MLMFKILLTVFVVLMAGTRAPCQDGEFLVRSFRVDSGLATKISSELSVDYLQIVDEQATSIERLKKDFGSRAEEIKTLPDLRDAVKLRRLEGLKKEFESKLKQVLLPSQLARVDSLAKYQIIMREGFANSAVHGLIAMELGLTVEERKKLKAATSQALKEYEKQLVAAQKQAIERIRNSLPVAKQLGFDGILDPMLRGDGTFWTVPNDMLDLSKSRPTYVFPKLPGLD
jgi:uncharacterized protein YbjQ (UPF0145 family)